MNVGNRQDLGLGRRVKAFLAQYWGEIAPLLGTALPALESLRSRLEVAIVEVDHVAEDRGLNTQKTVVRTRKYLRRILHRYYLRMLQRVSQLIEEAQPGRGPVIDVPPDSENEEVLLTAARSSVKSASQNRALFEQFGMPSDMLERIGEIVAAIDSARGTKDTVVRVRVRANASTESALRRVKRIVRCMSPILYPMFDSMPEQGPSLRRAWESASRRHQPPQPPTPADPAAQATPIALAVPATPATSATPTPAPATGGAQ